MKKLITIALAVVVLLTLGLVPVTPVMASPGIVALWHFDEGAGTSVADSVGSNTGTLVNSPGWVAGKFGRALSFDGTSNYVDIGTTNLVTGAFTVEFWAYSSSEDAEAFLELKLDSVGFISYKDQLEEVLSIGV